MQESDDVFAFVYKNKPSGEYVIHLTFDKTDQPRPLLEWDAESQWITYMLKTGGTRLIEIHYEGQPGNDKPTIEDSVRRKIAAWLHSAK